MIEQVRELDALYLACKADPSSIPAYHTRLRAAASQFGVPYWPIAFAERSDCWEGDLVGRLEDRDEVGVIDLEHERS